MQDEHNLQRFLDAQEASIESVLEELRQGKKRGHWMWFIFPQFQGLGESSTSEYFAIRSLKEAKAYLANEILGTRLTECTKAVLSLPGATPEKIFGYPDILKFGSSMTLFEMASGEGGIFSRALEQLFAGKRDNKTLALIKNLKPPIGE